MKEQKNNVVIGVINWDCSLPRDTFFGSFISKTLSPAEYRERVPYYADRLEDGTIAFHRRTLQEYEKEMQYAIDAGIHYFAYCWYGADSKKQTERLTDGPGSLVDDYVNELTFARKLHVQSSLKRQLKLCGILSVSHPYTDEELTELAEHMKQEYYQTVDERPLVYIFSDVKLVSIIARLREICMRVGTKKPYIALLTDESRLPKELSELLDGVSGYSCPKGNITTYAELTDAVITANSNRAQCGLDVIPHFSVGWNPKPRITNPVPWYPYEYVEYVDKITKEEYLEAAQRFADWISNHREQIHNNHILTYAWNEFEEGGYICPTFRADGSVNTSMLDVFAQMIGKWNEV